MPWRKKPEKERVIGIERGRGSPPPIAWGQGESDANWECKPKI